MLGELAVGSGQILRCGAQLTVCRVDLLDQRIVVYRRLLDSGLFAFASVAAVAPGVGPRRS